MIIIQSNSAMEAYLHCSFHKKPTFTKVYFHNFPPLQNQKSSVFIADVNSKLIANKHLEKIQEADLLVIPSGEIYKTKSTTDWIENELFKRSCNKHTTLIAVGGGVVLDLVGFVAATYYRGVEFIAVPTTFLAMVDACLGGKNGVNTLYGKNLLGTIYPASSVWLDLDAAKTWSKAHLQEGMAEVIKSALIADCDFFSFLEAHVNLFLSKDHHFLEECIKKTLTIKKGFVAQDPEDAGMRRCLNFGHTIAHALEQTSSYRISHGQAVALGLCVETWLSHLMYPNLSDVLYRLIDLLRRMEFPLIIPKDVTISQLINTCLTDKKNLRHQTRCVVLESLGAAGSFDGDFCAPITKQALEMALEWMFATFKQEAYVSC